MLLLSTVSGELSHREVQSEAVFTNSEISLKHVEVYGFDFDYTLLQYTQELHRLIYTSACKRLVDKLSVRAIAYILTLLPIQYITDSVIQYPLGVLPPLNAYFVRFTIFQNYGKQFS